MHIITIGINHKTAPVELREQLAFSADTLEKALKQLRDTKSILECVILSTCNRVELYVVADQLHTGRYYSKSFLASWFNIPMETFSDHLYIKEETAAIRHLFTVSCGLDSMMIGETQILGQVRTAFLTAQDAGTTGTVFNELFKRAVTLGKRMQSETEIGQNAVSVSYAAVELGKKLFDILADKTILLIGAGKTAELTATHFQAAGATKFLVLNRTLQNAEEVARRFAGEARPLDQLEQALREADVVVSSTGAPGTVVTREMAAEALFKRTSPVFFIDIAVPRDIDPEIHSLDNAYLYDIDDLQAVVAANLELREQEAEKVREAILDGVISFREWMKALGVIPLISALREKALHIQGETMRSIERKLPDLTERELRVLSKHTKSIVNQLLRDPITRVKELAAGGAREEALEMFTVLFALEEKLEQQEGLAVEKKKKDVRNPQQSRVWTKKEVPVRS